MDKLLHDTIYELGGCCSNCDEISTCVFLRFGLICMFFGFLVVVADFLTYWITPNRYSFLRMKYSGFFKTTFMIIAWTVCSFIVGYLGAATKLFDTHEVVSALVVAFSWQFVLARWAAGKIIQGETQPEEAT